MIPENSVKNKAQIHGEVETSDFSIKSTPEAFRILSSGLYSNKVRAVIRELSTNAWDGHIVAGNTDTPFDVHLPNHFSPIFRIRDYGCGLDHDEIVNIYTTYFESTKRSSNDQNGMLGLGSKSPFSMTDNFTVTTIKNGTKRIYTTFISDEGKPAVAKLYEGDTDEHTGVEVEVHISNDYLRFNEWAKEAAWVYSSFPIAPRVYGGGDDFEEKIESEKLGTIIKDVTPGVDVVDRPRGTAYVTMALVRYPIDINQINLESDERHLICCNSLHVRANTGEVSFAASREHLEYNEKTRTTLQKYFRDYIAKIRERIHDDIADIDHNKDLEKYAMIKYYRDEFGGKIVKESLIDTKTVKIDTEEVEVFYIKNTAWPNCKYNKSVDRLLDDMKNKFKSHDLSDGDKENLRSRLKNVFTDIMFRFLSSGEVSTNSRGSSIDFFDGVDIKSYKCDHYINKFLRPFNDNFNYHHNDVYVNYSVYLGSSDLYNGDYAKGYIVIKDDKKPLRKTIVYNKNKFDRGDNVTLVHFKHLSNEGRKKAIAEFKKLTGLPGNCFIHTSDLDSAPSVSSVRKSNDDEVAVRSLSTTTHAYRSVIWDDILSHDAFDVNKKYAYVVIDGHVNCGKIKMPMLNNVTNITECERILEQMLNSCFNLNIVSDHKTIIGVPKKHLKFVKKNTKWIDINKATVSKIKVLKNNITEVNKKLITSDDQVDFMSLQKKRAVSSFLEFANRNDSEVIFNEMKKNYNLDYFLDNSEYTKFDHLYHKMRSLFDALGRHRNSDLTNDINDYIEKQCEISNNIIDEMKRDPVVGFSIHMFNQHRDGIYNSFYSGLGGEKLLTKAIESFIMSQH